MARVGEMFHIDTPGPVHGSGSASDPSVRDDLESMRISGPFIAFSILAFAGCGDRLADSADQLRQLGPADGFELPAVDTGRVGVGDPAPDCTLPTFRGDTITLSEFQGKREVILVFYRGSW
jgi:hypothetical protein